jgi:pyrroloquinoline quinone (PQQ) biosynthesis protein C
MNVEEAQLILQSNLICQHQFLHHMNTFKLSGSQVRRFGIQWYKAATAHKRAFPGLIYNTIHDVVRFDLVHILRDEYGNGDVASIHAFMLLRFLNSLGYSEGDIAEFSTLPEIMEFSRRVDDIWLRQNPVKAFGVHYSLEVLAAKMHQSFGRGLRTAAGSAEFDLEYFNYHGVAEIEHADISDRGLLIYGEHAENRALLTEGLEEGKDLICLLWDGLDKHVFGSDAESKELRGMQVGFASPVEAHAN